MKISGSVVLANLLVRAGLVTSSGPDWPCFIAFTPDKPANCVTVYDTAPVKHGKTMQGNVTEMFGCQVRVRASGYLVGWDKINAIKSHLDGVKREEVTEDVTVINPADGKETLLQDYSYIIYSVFREGGVLPIGVEEGSRRHLFTLNVLMTLREVSQ